MEIFPNVHAITGMAVNCYLIEEPDGLVLVDTGLRNYERRIKDVIGIDNVSAVVCPATALGGIPVLWALKSNIPVIAVKDNKTILDVTRARLNLDGVVEVENYAEAAGILQALRKGISLQSIYRPLHTLRF